MLHGRLSSLMVSVLDSRLKQEVQIWDLARSMCCVLAQTLFSQWVSAQEYKWVPVNSHGSLMKCWVGGRVNLAMDWHPIQGGEVILLVTQYAMATRISFGCMATWLQYRLNHHHHHPQHHHFYYLGTPKSFINITFPASQCKWDAIVTSRGDINLSIAIKNQLGYWIVTLTGEKMQNAYLNECLVLTDEDLWNFVKAHYSCYGDIWQILFK